MSFYLSSYQKLLEEHPVRTKAITSGSLNGIQELVAQVISRKALGKGPAWKVDSKIIKMFAYGYLIHGPLSHYLTGWLAKMFAGKKGFVWMMLQLLAANLIVAPIQNSVYLAAMAVIAGKHSVKEALGAVKNGLLPMMKVSWVAFPLVQFSAFRFMPPQFWVPYFSLVGFLFGLYFNTLAKIRAGLEKRKKPEE